MEKINFLFGIHCHQPIGNFGHVFEESYERCYRPFIDILLKYPKIRCALHFTGPLLEWIEINKKCYFDKIRELVSRNQVEILSGGFYEPIIAVIPDTDSIGQIKLMNDYIESNFGYKPRGMWLAERVWEPSLPSILHSANIDFTLLDDSHFFYAGLTSNDIFGYYITENQGKMTRLFPIDKNMRYLIPFAMPDKAIGYLKEVAAKENGKAVIMADDGEKFGVWPNTYNWVYTEGYLERLFSMLEKNSDWINMMTYSEYIENCQPLGKIYLPTSSYEEMMEWALPSETIIQYEKALLALEKDANSDLIKPFFRGGFWRNFLAKYHESNLMHKKMIWVSKMVHKYAQNDIEAKKELWRGQCNCPYWHGLFGGVYLNYLRDAIYNHLNKAEKIASTLRFGSGKWNHLDHIDFNCDGRDSILFSTSILNAYIDPHRGATCFEIDYKPASFNLNNTFARKHEAYHEKLKKIDTDSQSKDDCDANKPVSIHDMVVSKEDGLDKILYYDNYYRHSFVDRFFSINTTLENVYSAKYKELGDFFNQPYKIDSKLVNDSVIEAVFSKTGHILIDGKKTYAPLRIIKKYSIIAQDSLIVDYTLKNGSADIIEVLFGSELNLSFLAGNDPQRYYVLPSGIKEPMNLKGATKLTNDNNYIILINEWDNIKVRIDFESANYLWRYPVETVSQSEGGFEKTYQNSAILPLWNIVLHPHEPVNLSISLIFNSAR